MKIKIADLTGPALRWAVYQCEDQAWSDYDRAVQLELSVPPRPSEHVHDYQFGPSFMPDTNWAQGGPIMDRARIGTEPFKGRQDEWRAFDLSGGHVYAGPTKLIAGMRCFVASRLGDEVDVPDELVAA